MDIIYERRSSPNRYTLMVIWSFNDLTHSLPRANVSFSHVWTCTDILLAIFLNIICTLTVLMPWSKTATHALRSLIEFDQKETNFQWKDFPPFQIGDATMHSPTHLPTIFLLSTSLTFFFLKKKYKREEMVGRCVGEWEKAFPFQIGSTDMTSNFLLVSGLLEMSLISANSFAWRA